MLVFKKAWDSYKSIDEERLLGLRIAYVTLNEHPAGSKDQLDFAPGSEEYHSVHEQYHPHYRATLHVRSYYNIFMLDLEGNCIYSVYKELDSATNFRADGSAERKDSGSGEALEAALKSHDQISVIDRKPSGASAGALASFLATGIR
jgi:methyl-accepting chemotaxis protein